MSDRTRVRLCARKEILEIIERRRLEEGDPGIGASVERTIIAEELRALDIDVAISVAGD